MNGRRFRAIGSLPAAIAGALVALLSAAHADGPPFSWPLDCDPTTEDRCFVLQYMDHDTGPDYTDFTCAKRSYDGHGETDIAVDDLQTMRKGVDVKMAAGGVVAVTRDGVADKLADPQDPEVAAIGCGNAVVVDHDDGWRTAYCHLREGSVRVQPGEAVDRGQVIGQVGLSGLTQHPHVAFHIYRDKKGVDPYTGFDATTACGGARNPLWTPEAAKTARYQFVDIPTLAFLDTTPSDSLMLEGPVERTAMMVDSPPTILAVQAFGLLAGDVLEVTLRGPDGSTQAHQEATIGGNSIRMNAAVPLDTVDWESGSYEAVASVLRPSTGEEVMRHRSLVMIAPE